MAWVAERKDVLLVPNAALRFKPANANNQKPTGNQPGTAINGDTAKPKRDAFSGKVYVMEQGELVPVSVTLGITDNRNTEIVTGELKAGDQAVVGETQAASSSSSSSASTRPPMRMF